jgi:hypothetical protein
MSVGPWRLVLLADMWSRDLEEKVLELVDAQPWAKHPQTLSLRLPVGGKESEFYLKIFHPARGALKDALRLSKAFRAWRQGIALHSAGFAVPLTIVAGERRRCRLLCRAFMLTRKVDGQAVPLFLRSWLHCGDNKLRLATKRDGLRRVADLVRRFHRSGFVHGDLVASNIFVSDAGGERIFYFMDNDRTRRYPTWVPQSFWKRNLIQLNRMPLPGITLQDRMRFFKSYLGSRRLVSGERRLGHWLARDTRRRRAECDGVDVSGDFRRLMRWSEDFSGATNAE